MSVHTAELGDVYRDAKGDLWLVRWRCDSPTIGVEKLVTAPVDETVKMSGGVGGLMWNGFVKLAPKGETE